jgi:hypothetical protein
MKKKMKKTLKIYKKNKIIQVNHLKIFQIKNLLLNKKPNIIIITKIIKYSPMMKKKTLKIIAITQNLIKSPATPTINKKWMNGIKTKLLTEKSEN